MYDFYFDNNGNSVANYIASEGVHFMHDLKIDIPDQNLTGFYATEDGCVYQNIYFTGGGSTAETPIRLSGDSAIIDNIFLQGTWKAGGNVIETEGADCNISNINSVDISQTLDFDISGEQTVLTNVQGAFNILLTNATDAIISNVDMDGGTFDVGASDYVRVSNISNMGVFDLSDSSATAGTFSNFRTSTGTLVTIAGDLHHFTNVIFYKGASVSSGADDNGFTNCRFGGIGGGGSDTLTIVSGANRTRVCGCATDAAISDSGTGTVTAANTIY